MVILVRPNLFLPAPGPTMLATTSHTAVAIRGIHAVRAVRVVRIAAFPIPLHNNNDNMVLDCYTRTNNHKQTNKRFSCTTLSTLSTTHTFHSHAARIMRYTHAVLFMSRRHPPKLHVDNDDYDCHATIGAAVCVLLMRRTRESVSVTGTTRRDNSTTQPHHSVHHTLEHNPAL